MKAKYRIVESTSPEMLETIINDLVDEGWLISGELQVVMAVNSQEEHYLYVQRMVEDLHGKSRICQD